MVNRIHTIYKIVNSSNGRVYVGCTNKEKPFYRMTEHMRNAFKENIRGYDSTFYKEVREFSKETFMFSIIVETDCPELAKSLENTYISDNQRRGVSLNSRRSSGVASKESLNKRSKSNKGNRNAQGERSAEVKGRISKGRHRNGYWNES